MPPIIVDEISDQIGERLRTAREGAGLSVEEVAVRTRIPKSVIEALEAADFGVFDSQTYARSYLSQYSEFLDVDARIWLDAFEPASFAPVEVVQPSWQAHHSRKDPNAPPRQGTGDWISALRGLALSCGLIYAAILAYQLLEARFGGDAGKLKISREKSAEPAIPPSPDPPPLTDPRKPAAEIPGGGETPPPPRPTIIRENP